MVCGYHVYEEIWDASIDEELLCTRQPTNPHDPFTFAIIKYDQTSKCQNFAEIISPTIPNLQY